MTVILSRGLRGQALSLHSPSVTFQSTSISQRRTLHMSGALDFCDATCGTPFDHLTQMASSASIHVSHRTNNWRVTSWLIVTPGQGTDRCLKQMSTLSWESGLFAWPGTLAWGAGVLFGTHLGAFWGKDTRMEVGGYLTCALPLPHSRLPTSSRRKLVWHSDFWDYHTRDPSRLHDSGEQ